MKYHGVYTSQLRYVLFLTAAVTVLETCVTVPRDSPLLLVTKRETLGTACTLNHHL
ncbi:MAG: hypothetical protein GF331_22975 [Chitinivibrionales bacterium]|nr:hypothetical protein [Chitinivibrionales bacterium]